MNTQTVEAVIKLIESQLNRDNNQLMAESQDFSPETQAILSLAVILKAQNTLLSEIFKSLNRIEEKEK